MSNKIEGFNGVPGAASLTPQVGGVGTARRNSGKDAVTATSDVAPVSLSPDAVQLQNLQAAVEGASEVNESRVEAVRAAIANGSYRIDADAIASKLLSLEPHLPK